MSRKQRDLCAAFARLHEGRGAFVIPNPYDVGSALFEVISLLPEYGLTRADERLLRRHAENIVQHVPGKVTVAELGSGSGKKTRCVLEALGCSRQVWYCPIEISAALGLTLGPIEASVDRVGVKGLISFPDHGGNLGPANLAIDFKPHVLEQTQPE